MQTLKGRALYSSLRLIDPIGSPLQDKNSEDYWRVAFGKKVFIVREDVANGLNDATIAEINLEDTEREVEGEDGTTTTVAGVQYAGHLTYKQAKNIITNEGELLQLEQSFVVKASAMPVEAA